VVASGFYGGPDEPANLAAQLAAAETELTCLKIALAQAREDRDELQQERDAWRRVAEKLNDCALKLREADERRLAFAAATLAKKSA
jgi:hypothetical protein